MTTLWHRFLLRLEIRKRLPSGLQCILSVPLRSCRVSVEENTVDLEHAMVRRVWTFQILPLLERGGSAETFSFRTEIDGSLIVTVHTEDPRAA